MFNRISTAGTVCYSQGWYCGLLSFNLEHKGFATAEKQTTILADICAMMVWSLYHSNTCT